MKDNFTSTITKEFIPYKLPNNWKWFWWSDLISNYQQGMIRSNSQLGKGNAEYLKMGDLDSNGRANFSSLAKTEASQKEIKEFLLKEGDFLINVRNSKELVGKTCLIEKVNNRTVLFNHMLVRMDHGSVELNYYINAFLNIPSSKKMLDRIKQGTTTVIALYQRDLNKLPISLPDSETFISIVNLYKSINAKIELNNRINSELESMAKTLYDYWFVQFNFPYSPPLEGCPQDGVGTSTPLSVTGKPYKTSGGKMVWNEELKREIPEGWQSGCLSDIANITMGQSPPGESYNEEGNGMIFYQGCTDFGNRFPTIRKFTTSPTRFAKQGDILLSVRAPVGTLNISKEDCCIGRGLACMNSKNDSITYLFGVMVNLKQIFDRRNVSGTTFGSITKDDLFSLPVIIPNEKTVRAFQNLVFPAFEKQNKIELENIELSSLRDWLLPMLMNGQLSVGDVVALRQTQDDKLGMVAEERAEYK